MLRVRRIIDAGQLHEPALTHARALTRRASENQEKRSEIESPAAWAASIQYLATRVDDSSVTPEEFAVEHGLDAWEMLPVLPKLRVACRYRAYMGEWIREGRALSIASGEKADLHEHEAGHAGEYKMLDRATEDAQAGSLLPLQVVEHESSDQTATDLRPPLSQEPSDSPTDQPRLWRKRVQLYGWQQEAAGAWEANNGRGIIQVVTGAGKTVLAAFLLAKLVDLNRSQGKELFTVVVVPRVALVAQWHEAITRHINASGIRIGEYFGGNRCFPPAQDILIITQDSARRILPAMVLDRPTLLIADECHRLGAPAASRVLKLSYSWTLGLSATPERLGDLAFEQILVPRLGPVIFAYGYQEAVRDGIISEFALIRVRVRLTPEESQEYDRLSVSVRRLLVGLRNTYPSLRAKRGRRFFQVLGDLRTKNPDDRRFEQFAAATAARREIVHLCQEKRDVVASLCDRLVESAKVLCFHERIEAAEDLLELMAEKGVAATAYHSQLPLKQRTKNLESFRNGAASWLVACRSLDEGVDIPSVDTIVIVAGSRSPRQVIQRLGRALRRTSDGRPAQVFFLEVDKIDEDIIDQAEFADLKEAANEVLETDAAKVSEWLHHYYQLEPAPQPAENGEWPLKPDGKRKRWFALMDNAVRSLRGRGDT